MFKKIFLLALLISTATSPFLAQTIKKNTVSQTRKDDPNNYYRSKELSQLDLLEAMDFAGIKVTKFKLGNFNAPCNITVLLEEFVDAKLKKTDTILSGNNLYSFYKGKKRYLDYIDQIKIQSSQEGNICNVRAKTYAMETGFKLICDTTIKTRFYNWRSFTGSPWKINKKIPLIIFASSWTDKKYGFQRFCGVVKLKENESATNELISQSPHYFLLSYKVTKVN